MSSEYYYLKTGSSLDLENPKERRIYRLLEMLPAALAWITLLGVVFLSWRAPVFTAFFILIFDVYWLLKTVYLSIHLRSSFSKVRKNLKINWLKKLDEENLPYKNFYNLVIFPFYKEGKEVIQASLRGLMKANYPMDKMIVVLTAEEKGGEEAKQIIEDSKREFGDKFFRFLGTIHPQNLPGEMPGKGSNAAWAGVEAKEKIIDALKIPHDKVIVSTFDVDTVIYPDYFARLTYVYLHTENPERWSYQPIPFYINNIWQAPALARVVSFSSTFWHTIQQERIERLTTFSSHSMSIKALLDVDFWQRNMVSEDSRIFWQCLLRYDGKYGVQPLYFPVMMDSNVADTFWQTMMNQYKQQRRWAWGAENTPYFLFGFLKNKKIGRYQKIHYSWIYIESVWSWATNAIIIFMLGWLPVILGGDIFRQTLLAYNLPQTARWLMDLSMLGIITSAFLTMLILPPKPPEYGRYRYILMVIQWPLLLITMILFGAVPALEAQTRLALGGKNRLGFWVTPKHR